MVSYGVYLMGGWMLLEGCALLTKGRGILCFSNGKAGRMRERVMRDAAFSLQQRARRSDWLRRRREEKVDGEIYESISFLRNITALGRGRNVSAGFVIEQLSLREGILQGIFGKMLHFLRVGRKEEAMAVFAGETATPMGKEFGGLLLQWDEMDPAELTEILISHQKSIKEVRLTVQKRRDEMISDLIYLPVVVNVIILFINFIYVAYFMEQQKWFEMIF